MVEKKTLGIIAIVFGGLGLLLSWVPIVNNFAFLLGLIGIILGIIALIVNRKNKKTLTFIGSALSIATIVVVLITQSMYSSAVKTVSEKITTTQNTQTPTASSSSEKKLSEEEQDKQILADYTVKLQEQTPQSIASYNDKAKTNQEGITGLAKLNNDEVSVLAKISTEGIQKMGQAMLTTGSGNQDTYRSYAAQLQDVYTAEAGKLTENYTKTAIGQ